VVPELIFGMAIIGLGKMTNVFVHPIYYNENFYKNSGFEYISKPLFFIVSVYELLLTIDILYFFVIHIS
jgi:hypothetical protein